MRILQPRRHAVSRTGVNTDPVSSTPVARATFRATVVAPKQESSVPQEKGSLPLPTVFTLFLVSGFAALVYQVVWQRALFAIYGVNIESVTIVVTAFMLGLGLGSFVGGQLSRDPTRRVLLWFAAIELAIGVYGAGSLLILHSVGLATAGAGPVATFGLSFALVLVPTALMGATLPLLVAHLVRRSGNVGRSVGALYFVNTLGSAAAALATAMWILGGLGQQGTVWLAAACNLAVGAAVLYLRRRYVAEQPSVSERSAPLPQPAPSESP
jgi:predicted membrane-bound spermidine synthase